MEARKVSLAIALCLVVAPLCAFAQGPVVTVVAPTPAQEVRGLVGLSAAASGDVVVSVQFRVDGIDQGKAVAPGTCCVMWDSRTSTDGFHTVQAIGRDRFGNILTSQPVTFLVNNFSPEPAAAQQERQSAAAEPMFTAASIGGALVKRAPEPGPSQSPGPSAAPVPPPPPPPKPPAASSPTPRPAPAQATPARPARGSCVAPDPFEAIGGIGICIGGEWVLLWKPNGKN